MPDVFSLLSEDHRKVESLFQEFERSGDSGIAMQICQELSVHALLEEELVYPVVATKLDTGVAAEARQEHDQAKQVISQIESGIGRGEDVTALVRELQQEVQHHVEEEENEIFPQMAQKVPNLVSQMGNDVMQRKEELLTGMAEARGSQQPPSSVGNKATDA